MSGITDKVAKLLNKAEGTDNEEEANAFLAKAQELMQRYSLQQWEVDKLRAPQERERPTVDRTTIISKRTVGNWDKRSLLSTIAELNRCDMWYSGDVCSIAGFPSDIEFVKMMYNHLNAQLTRDAMFSMAVRDSHHKTHKASFIRGWVSRVNSRLRENTRQLEAVTSASDTGMALALIEKREAVQRYIEVDLGLTFHTASYTRSSHDGSAYQGGRIAGGKANLSPAQRRGLPSAS